MPLTAFDIDEIVMDLWRETRHGQNFAGKAVAEVFARTPRLSGPQRERIVETLYGLLGQARRIEHALNAGSGACPGRIPKAYAPLLAYRVLEGQMPPEKAAARLPQIDWAAVIAADQALAREPDPVKRIGITDSLPECVAERLAAQYGDQAGELARALRQRAPLFLRVNTLKAERKEVLDVLAQAGLEARPARFSRDGIELKRHANVFKLLQFEAGLFEVQDEASQLVAELAAPPPGGLVVDYCAGAGGKALALGAWMRNQGRLVCCDVNERKLGEFGKRARRAGLFNARTIRLDPGGEWPAELRALCEKAGRVLADVPCSGVGVFRRKPEMRWRLRREDLIRLPQEQEAIARRAMKLCAPGGRLIYATCTVLAEENERVIERLASDTGFQVMPIKEILGKARAAQIGDSTGTFLKLLPHRHGTDGFFAAVLRRMPVKKGG